MDPRPKTIICDIDGTLFEHTGDIADISKGLGKMLPGVLEAFKSWDAKGYKIILMTGRRESARLITEEQLRAAGLFFDMLIMGCGGGVRVLINDNKPDGQKTAEAITIKRNEGLKGIKI